MKRTRKNLRMRKTLEFISLLRSAIRQTEELKECGMRLISWGGEYSWTLRTAAHILKRNERHLKRCVK